MGKIYCCECKKDIQPWRCYGSKVYPNREDLKSLVFWLCGTCNNFVGSHKNCKKGNERPLGVIANKEIKNARQHIHKILDPLWKDGKYLRKEVYSIISKKIGKEYHTAEIRTLDEARQIYKMVKEL